MGGRGRRVLVAGLLAVGSLGGWTAGRAQAAAPTIEKIDPPGWWVGMPAAMLLVRGEHLAGARFALSDPALAVSSARVSANGHWAVLQLSATPAQPETVRVVVSGGGGKATAEYRFEKRRPASEGFAGFSSRDVMYLIMTDRFADGDPGNDGLEHAAQSAASRGWHGGDLRGVLEHLDYLQELGITTVWLTPVQQNREAGSYHGYGATDLYAVDEHFGSLGDLQALAAALHKRGMKLVLDTVPNHVGPANPWVNDEPEPDWFHGTAARHSKAVGEFAPLVNPHAPWRDQKDILDGWFADILPDMNQENPDASAYLIENAVWWVEQTGADGLRIDTFPYVGRPFWNRFHASLAALYPRLTTVGEVFNRDPAITSAFAGGVRRTDLDGAVDTGLGTPFDFPTYFALRDVLLHAKPMTEMADVLRQDSLYPHPERLVPFLGNHDVVRFMSEPGSGPDRLKLAFGMLLTMRGTPQIYSGDEIAMEGGEDPDNRRNFPGGFGGQSAFTAAGRTPEQAAMYDWVHGLLTLRSRHGELNAGEEQVLYADADLLVYARGEALREGCRGTQARQRVLVIVNKAAGERSFTLPTANTALAGCVPGGVELGGMRAGAAPEEMVASPGLTVVGWR